MALHISISSAAEAHLKAKAVAAGVDVETYAARQLELLATAPPSIAGIAGHNTPAAELDEQAIAELLEVEKHAMRLEKRSTRPG